MAQNEEKRKKTLTAVLIASAVVLVGAAIGLGLWWTSRAAAPAGSTVSEMPLVSSGESSVPENVVSQPDPIPGELLPETFRALWLTKDDLSLNDPDGTISPAADTGFTLAVIDLPAEEETLSAFAAKAREDGLAAALSFSVPPTADELTAALAAAGETVAAVFLPVSADVPSLTETLRTADKRIAVGLCVCDHPSETPLPAVNMIAVCPDTDETVLPAWGEKLAGTDTALIAVLDINDKTTADPALPARLLRDAEKTANYRGCAVRNAEAMYADGTGAVSALLLALDGNGDDVLGGELAIVEPTETTFSTYGTVFTLRGSCNPIYPLRVNGEELIPSEDGNFVFTSDLSVGENVFTVTHRDKTVILTVDRKIDVLRAVSPSAKVEEDGGVYLTLTAKALPGSRITATLSGRTVTLAEEEAVETETEEGYVTFSALYLLPEAQAVRQDLGKVTFKGTNEGFSETTIGGRVYVKADPSLAPTPTPTPTPAPTDAPSDTPTDAPSPSPSPSPSPTPPPAGNVLTAKVTASHLKGVNDTKTYNPSYRDDKSAPTQYFLATGMIDTVVKEVNFNCEDGYIKCYQLSGGALIHQSDCTTSKRAAIQNHISAAALSEEGKHTVLRFKGSEPVAIYPSLTPLSFTGSHSLGYSVANFASTKVELLFSNTYSTADILGFDSNPLFSSYQWVKVKDGQYKLVLTLKKAGAFYGIGTEIDSRGRVVVSFKNPVSLKKADNDYGYSLSGITVVLDAGHNGNYPLNPGAAGFEEGLHECNLNLILAEKTKKKLEALGAKVVMTRTDNACTMTDDERVKKIITADADACIAIHHNGATSTSAYGTSAYYFYPFAKGLSQAVYDRMVAVYQSSIYPSGTKKTGCAEGCKYYPYYMTRVQEYPCILVEAGYITNREEYYILIRDDIQEKIADAFTGGIVDFLAAQ